MSILGEEAFGLIKTVTRLKRTNPSFGIDRMDDYQAMHQNIQCAVHFFRPHAMMPRKRSILGEEASGAIKTLKRLERTNPSVIMD